MENLLEMFLPKFLPRLEVHFLLFFFLHGKEKEAAPAPYQSTTAWWTHLVYNQHIMLSIAKNICFDISTWKLQKPNFVSSIVRCAFLQIEGWSSQRRDEMSSLILRKFVEGQRQFPFPVVLPAFKFYCGLFL